MEKGDISSLTPVIGLSAVTASLCCLPSVIWVLFAGSSAIVAANSLSETLYYSSFRYLLYAISFFMLLTGLFIHFRKRGICSLDDAKKNQRRVINTSLAVFTITIGFYLLWNYVILEIIGIAIGLPWEESAFWN
jgi:bacteriorhodopsin